VTAAVKDIFVEKTLSILIGHTSVLKPHQRHQFSVLIDGAIPAMQLAALLQLV